MAIWTPTQKTKTKKLKIEGCKHSYEVEVPYIRIQEAIENVYVRLQLQAKVAGFRQGKAPLEVIKKRYGGSAHQEAADQVLKQVIPEALKDLDLRPIAMPEVGGLHLHPNEPMKFELHVEVAPAFKVTGYKGINVTRKEVKIEEKDVEARLKQLQDGNARLEKATEETVGENHYVVIDYELTRDGKAVEGGKGSQELVDMSSDQTIDGLIANLKGMKRDESRNFEVKIEDKPADCAVTVKEIKSKILPAMDDDFAKDMGLDSLEKLKAELKTIIEKENKEKADREASGQIEQALIKANKFDLPSSLVDHQLNHMMQRFVERIVGPGKQLPEEQLKELSEKMRPQAEDQVRLQFVLAEIAKVEKIEVTDADFDEELKKTLEAQPDDKEKAKAREFFEKNKDDIRGAIRERKVILLIRESAKIKEEKA